MQTTLDDNKKFADFIANNYKKKKKKTYHWKNVLELK
jgi:hypothetical protein